MKQAAVIVNEAKRLGAMKPLNGVNNGPLSIFDGQKFKFDASGFFQEAAIPRVRLHDVEYPYGGDRFVDYECIFPNFDADVNDESNYYFEDTDRYLAAISGAGAKLIYRLGVSIEGVRVKRFIYPPRNFQKFAEICEHIVAHYAYGWKNGFYYKDILWEIWNEPNGTEDMWTGGNDAYAEMYAVTAKHLKKCFPNEKIGGPAVSYMTGVLWPNCQLILDVFKKKLQDDPQIPLDFFSWHNYACEPEDVLTNTGLARQFINDCGHPDAMLVMDEYNYMVDWGRADSINEIPTPQAAAFLAANLAVMQNSEMAVACYYSAQIWPEPRSTRGGFFKPPTGNYAIRWNGLFHSVGDRLEKLPPFEAMLAFGELRRLGTQIEADVTGDARVYALAAANDAKAAAYIVNFSGEPVELTFRGEKSVLEPWEIRRRRWKIG